MVDLNHTIARLTEVRAKLLRVLLEMVPGTVTPSLQEDISKLSIHLTRLRKIRAQRASYKWYPN